MKKPRILDGQWRVQSQFDVYADGYYVGTTRNGGGSGNNYDIDHAILIADAGNTYHATGMLPSEMAERIKELEDGLRDLEASCPILECEDFTHTKNTYHRHGEKCRPLSDYLVSLSNARALLTQPIDDQP
jgi:hypothetical protein